MGSLPLPGLRGFRRLALLSCAATYLLIFVGGLVRVSGAGLGCPDWPRCFGSFVPPLDASQVPPEIDPSLFNVTLAWIEYINRLLGVTVGLLLLATAIWALARFRRLPSLWVPAVAAAVLVAIEGWLGSLVVSSLLAPWIVTAHLVLALVIAGLLLYLTLESYRLEHPHDGAEASYPAGTRPLLAVLWVVGLVVTGLGAHIRGAIEQLADSYPLLADHQLLDRLGGIRSVHLGLGLLLALLTAVVALRVLRRSRHPSPVVKVSAAGALGVIALQIAVGSSFVLIGLPAVAQLFHQWLASLFLGLLLIWWCASLDRRPVSSAAVASLPAAAPGRRPGLIGAGVAATLILLAAAVLVVALAERSLRELPILATLPALEPPSFSGGPTGPLRPAPAARAGDRPPAAPVRVVALLPADCGEPCRTLEERMSELERATDGSRQVEVLAIADPDADDARRRQRVSEREWFTVASSDTRFEELAAALLGPGPPTRLALVDKAGRVRGRYDALDPASLKVLKTHLRQLVNGAD